MGHCKICGIVLNHTSYTHCKLHYWERHWEGMTGQQLIDECVNRTNDESRGVRKQAAARLVKEGSSIKVNDELFTLLDCDCEYVREIVVSGLIPRTPHEWEQLIDECVNRTNDQSRRVRKQAAARLVKEGCSFENSWDFRTRVVDELFTLLDHHCEYVTGIVVSGLRDMPTTDFTNIESALEPNNNSGEKRLAALSLLTNIDNPIAIIMIEDSLKDPDPRVQHAAVNQVGANARKAKEARRYPLLDRMVNILVRVNPLNQRIEAARVRLLEDWNWSSNKGYENGDIVFHGGVLYISQKTDNINREPPNQNYWIDLS